MKMIRLFAEYIEGPEETLVLYCKLDNSGNISKNEAIGYVKDWNEDIDDYVKYPFLLSLKDENCELDYGYGETPSESTNIHKKKIAENELFTRFDAEGNEFQYKIKTIVHLSGEK